MTAVLTEKTVWADGLAVQAIEKVSAYETAHQLWIIPRMTMIDTNVKIIDQIIVARTI